MKAGLLTFGIVFLVSAAGSFAEMAAATEQGGAPQQFWPMMAAVFQFLLGAHCLAGSRRTASKATLTRTMRLCCSNIIYTVLLTFFFVSQLCNLPDYDSDPRIQSLVGTVVLVNAGSCVLFLWCLYVAREVLREGSADGR